MHVRDLIQFLGELSENNNRAWFVMNKPRYDILREEFLALTIKLIAEISKFDPAIAGCNPKKALFRINRDMRFSHDKRPYKTHFSAAITASGLKKPSQGGGPAYYFHINEAGNCSSPGANTCRRRRACAPSAIAWWRMQRASPRCARTRSLLRHMATCRKKANCNVRPRASIRTPPISSM
jgi:uncharacterized protein (TIGR02453 family)